MLHSLNPHSNPAMQVFLLPRHYTDEEIEAQRLCSLLEVTNHYQVVESGFKFRQLLFSKAEDLNQANVLNLRG